MMTCALTAAAKLRSDMSTIRSRIFRKVRLIAERDNGHRLVKFRATPDSLKQPTSLPDFYAWCKHCNQTVLVCVRYNSAHRHHAFVGIGQCGHPSRRTTYIIHSE